MTNGLVFAAYVGAMPQKVLTPLSTLWAMFFTSTSAIFSGAK
jgi:hypothetical protein